MSSPKKIETMQQAMLYCESKGIPSVVLTGEQALAICRASSDCEVKIVKPDTVELSDYKGNATVSFSGDFRPFSFGRSKCKVILRNIKRMQELAKEAWPEDFE